MKEQILEISKRLENDEITEREARKELCVLFGVSNSVCDHKNSYIVSGVFGGRWCEDCKEMIDEQTDY